MGDLFRRVRDMSLLTEFKLINVGLTTNIPRLRRWTAKDQTGTRICVARGFHEAAGIICLRRGQGHWRHSHCHQPITRRKRAVSAEMALKLGRLFNVSPELWTGIQADYDLELTEQT